MKRSSRWLLASRSWSRRPKRSVCLRWDPRPLLRREAVRLYYDCADLGAQEAERSR